MYEFEVYRQGGGQAVWLQIFAVPTGEGKLVIPRLVWELKPLPTAAIATSQGMMMAPLLGATPNPGSAMLPMTVSEPVGLADLLATQLAGTTIYPGMVESIARSAVDQAQAFLRHVESGEGDWRPGAYL